MENILIILLTQLKPHRKYIIVIMCSLQSLSLIINMNQQLHKELDVVISAKRVFSHRIDLSLHLFTETSNACFVVMGIKLKDNQP